MKLAYQIIQHALGLACIAACITIVATLGRLDIHWSGWIAVAFFAILSVGILLGWFPWRGKPLRVLLKGFYVMSAVALIGFGFTMSDPWRPQLWMVLAPVVAVSVGRAVFNAVTHVRERGSADGPDAAA